MGTFFGFKKVTASPSDGRGNRGKCLERFTTPFVPQGRATRQIDLRKSPRCNAVLQRFEDAVDDVVVHQLSQQLLQTHDFGFKVLIWP